MSAFSGKHFPILNIHLSRLQDLQKYTVVNDGQPPTIRELIFAALSGGLTLLEAGATPIPVPGGGRANPGAKVVHPLQHVVLSANILDLSCVSAALAGSQFLSGPGGHRAMMAYRIVAADALNCMASEGILRMVEPWNDASRPEKGGALFEVVAA